MSESTKASEDESYRLAMKKMLKPYLENLARYGETYPGATEDSLSAERYRRSRESRS